MFCCINGNVFFMICVGLVFSILEVGKWFYIIVIGYIDDKEVNCLEKEYIIDGNIFIEIFSVLIKEI